MEVKDCCRVRPSSMIVLGVMLRSWVFQDGQDTKSLLCVHFALVITLVCTLWSWLSP